MNARQRCRYRRQMRYRERCRMADEIRLLRLNLINSQKPRPTSAILDEIWGLEKEAKEQHQNMEALVEVILALKNKFFNTESKSSIDNRCLPRTYLLR